MFYKVTDTYGTKVRTWTLEGAIAWLPFCSPQARITRFGKLMASRSVVRS